MNTIFVPNLQPSLKHPTVFKKFDELKTGESFLLVNDHDPIPLFYEMRAERGNEFEWKKIENGPEIWKVEIKKTGGVSQNAEILKETTEDAINVILDLDVTQIEPRLKHPTIFKYFDALKPSEALCISNDHDPKPLYYQLLAERGNIFTWDYREKGPQWWKVQIKKNDESETVGQIAAKDIRKAAIFKKYGIDFCCGGKKSLEQVCNEKGLELVQVQQELENAKQTQTLSENFDRWNIEFLTDYIFNKHHQYYYDEAPVIIDLLTKVVHRHGDHFPELHRVQVLFLDLAQELNSHFQKEESIVFPFIKGLVEAKKTGKTEELQNRFSLSQPIQMMESEHEEAGEILAELNVLTNNYTPPSNACNSFQFLYSKLKDLEDDLHQHIHLENNILFPKALQLEKELRSK
jgi:regulator of cell morphogenesis and NO signaling